VTYELIYAPEQARYQQLSSAAALEQRVAALEQAVGKASMAAVGEMSLHCYALEGTRLGAGSCGGGGGCCSCVCISVCVSGSSTVPPHPLSWHPSTATFLDLPNASVGSAVAALARRVDALSEMNLADLEVRLGGIRDSLSKVGRQRAVAGARASS